MLVEVNNLCKSYRTGDGQVVQALRECNLSIAAGEVLGVVGESGCGKSTLGHTLLRLTEADSGSITFDGQDLVALSPRRMKQVRRDMQIIFQDPFGSLNPRHTVAAIIGEPLRVHRIGTRLEQKSRVNELLQLVGLPLDAAGSYPHEFSGGQRQRIAIARAISMKPKFLVADEAVSALDVSIQSQIINLIMQLQQQLSISMLFISHDLSVIRHVSDRIAVMYMGRIVETGETSTVLAEPRHPYTKALFSAIPAMTNEQVRPYKQNQGKQSQGKSRIVLQGELPDPANPPAGCVFHTRCQEINSSVENRCMNEVPQLLAHQQDTKGAATRSTACFLQQSEPA